LRNIPTAGICYYINGYCKQNYIHIGHHLPPFTVAVHLTFANRIKVCGCWKWNGGWVGKLENRENGWHNELATDPGAV